MTGYRLRRSFTIIAPVYNVGQFLDAFFSSLAGQTADIRDRVSILCVDDGSTDDSPRIIARWQKRLPNIRRLRKENGGRASARNLGLEHAEGDWLTFIDPDDYVAPDYFERVDRFLALPESADAVMASCRRLFYSDYMESARDTHYLRHQFTRGPQWISAADPGDFMEPSTSSVFYLKSAAHRLGLRFKEDIRPFFEDTEFNIRFLHAMQGGDIGVIPDAVYYYRVRAEVLSFIDSMQKHREFYEELFDNGYIRTLRDLADARGAAPVWAQRLVMTALYAQAQFFATAYGASRCRAFTTKEALLSRLRRTLALLDDEVVLGGSAGTAHDPLRLFLARAFKGLAVEDRWIRARRLDPVRRQLRLEFTGEAPRFSQGGRECVPAFRKSRTRLFLDDALEPEQIVWLDLRDLETPLDCEGGGRRFAFHGRDAGERLPLADLSLPLYPQGAAPSGVWAGGAEPGPHEGCWLFTDTPAGADDNGEHLYWHTVRHYPHIPAFFILRADSPDWERMRLAGARLIAHGGDEHKNALAACRCLLSSHTYAKDEADGFAAMRGASPSYAFIFLQHGVIKNDMSAAFAMNMDLFITSTRGEHADIAGDGTAYPLTGKEVILSGMPRHDALLRGAPEPERLILVMPTWRSSLPTLAGNARAFSAADEKIITGSAYFRHWRAFLHSPETARIAGQYGFRIVFRPHRLTEPYLALLDPPGHIEISGAGGGRSIQDSFRKTAVFITDYTSAAFDLALLRRCVIYYHFDAGACHTGGEHNRATVSYFEYERDGFGPVVRTETALLAALEAACRRGGAVEAPYAARAEAAFALPPEGSCACIMKAALALWKDGKDGGKDARGGKKT